MFELYNYNHKIPESRLLEMHDILIKDFINKKGILEYNEKKESFNKEGFDKWKSMLLNDPNYNIILYIIDNRVVGFICYLYMDKDVCLSEVQIIKEYQGKYGILRQMLKSLLSEINKDSNRIIETIDNTNEKSKNVFTHIGFINTNDNWYEISIQDLEKWVNKKIK